MKAGSFWGRGGVALTVLLTVVGGSYAQVTPPTAGERANQQIQHRQKIEDLRKPLAEMTDEEIANAEEVPEFVPGETQDSGPQFLVRRKQVRKWVDVYIDSQYYYQTNATQVEEPIGNEARDTGVLVNTAQVAIAPDPFDLGGGKLAPLVGFRYQWFNYELDRADQNGLNNFDFDSQTAYAEVRYQFSDFWIAMVGFEWQRLLGHESSQGAYNEIYRDYKPKWGIERRIPMGENGMWSLSYENSYHFTDLGEQVLTGGFRNRDDRMSHAFSLLYSHILFENFVLQPFYQFQLNDYSAPPQTSRTDYLHTAGLSMNYYITNYLGIRSFFTYSRRDSDVETLADYSNLDGGGGISVFLRF